MKQYLLTPIIGLHTFPAIPLAINSKGEITGADNFSTTPPVDRRILRYANGVASNLGTVSAQGHAINADGHIAGMSFVLLPHEGPAPHYKTHAVLHAGGELVDLHQTHVKQLPGARGSIANAINAGGEIVGGADGPEERAWYLRPRGAPGNYQLFDLTAVVGEPLVDAVDINDSRRIVGATKSSGAFFYDVDTSHFQVIPGMSRAAAVNASGTIVGVFDPDSGPTANAVLYDGTSSIPLGSLGGDATYPTDINDAGTVVGYQIDPDPAKSVAFVRDADGIHDVNDHVVNSSWRVRSAFGIDDDERIVGEALDGSGHEIGVLLTPVPTGPRLPDGFGKFERFGRVFGGAIFGGSGFIVFPGGHAKPIGPNDPDWWRRATAGMTAGEREAFAALNIHRLASLIDDRSERLAVQRHAAAVLAASANRLNEKVRDAGDAVFALPRKFRGVR